MAKITLSFRSLLIGVLLVILGGTVGFQLGRGKNIPFVSKVVNAMPSSQIINTQVPDQNKDVNFNEFWEVWNRLEKNYQDPSKLDAKKMVQGAIAGMTASLGDPYTLYLPPEEQKRTSDDLNGAFDGVGIQLGYKNQTLVVVAPLKGMPAEAAGVQAGDFILRIKDKTKSIDKDTAGITLPDAVSLIRGPKGSEVTLTFLREGGKPEEISLKRETILVPSVELTYLEKEGKTVAHLKLLQFGGRTSEEWDSAVKDILSKGTTVSGIALDVRNNPGGYLQEAVSIASEFIKDGVVVTQAGRVEKVPYYANGRGRLTQMPVVVLMNKGSASASEIVAGALRDRRGARLIGENSFGKGTVQDAQELPNGAGLHVTIARWLLPSGDWIHEKGLAPTTEIKPLVDEDLNDGNQPEDVQLNEAVTQVLTK